MILEAFVLGPFGIYGWPGQPSQFFSSLIRRISLGAVDLTDFQESAQMDTEFPWIDG